MKKKPTGAALPDVPPSLLEAAESIVAILDLSNAGVKGAISELQVQAGPGVAEAFDDLRETARAARAEWVRRLSSPIYDATKRSAELVKVIRDLFARTDQDADGDLSGADFLQAVGEVLGEPTPRGPREYYLHDSDVVGALAACVSYHTGICLADPLNPCWNNRPGDKIGRHWGGGEACAVCQARAVLAAGENAPRAELLEACKMALHMIADGCTPKEIADNYNGYDVERGLRAAVDKAENPNGGRS